MWRDHYTLRAPAGANNTGVVLRYSGPEVKRPRQRANAVIRGLATDRLNRKGREVIMTPRKPDKQINVAEAKLMAGKILRDAVPRGDCLIRVTHVNAGGYTYIFGPKVQGKKPNYLAHRVVVVARDGQQIPPGMTVDHVCENRACVAPDHLRLLSMAENVLRSANNPAAVNARKTHCIHGHAFTPENTTFGARGGRACRTCQRARQAAHQARRRAQKADSQDLNDPNLICPTCGRPASSSQTRIDGLQRQADCLCPAGHIFLVKWLVAA